MCTGGFIKTIIRVLRCVGHFNSKLLVDKVKLVHMLSRHAALASATSQHIAYPLLQLGLHTSDSQAYLPDTMLGPVHGSCSFSWS
jgi:hypothetical protein